MSKTVVFIHGNFVSRRCWEPWIARYESRGVTCVNIAYPGRDKSVAELRQNPDAALLAKLTLQQVADHCASEIRKTGEKPIVMGHSFGGLLTQLMVQRDLAAAAVAIDSVPPQGVLASAWSFYRSTWPAINPLVPASRPYMMSFPHFQYSFTNTMRPDEQRAAYDRDVVPESRRLSRGGLSSAARIDFRKPHAPLLLIAGEKDHIMPASLNRTNHARYAKSPSITDFKEFAGHDHYSIIGGRGWEEVADYALDWALRQTGALNPANAASAANRS